MMAPRAGKGERLTRTGLSLLRKVRGKQSEQLFSLANSYSPVAVQLQSSNCCVPNRREPDDLEAFPNEVGAPLVSARIEQRHGVVCFGNDDFNAIGLVQIAAGAGPRYRRLPRTADEQGGRLCSAA